MTPTALRFLAQHAEWLAHRPEALEAFDELADAVVVVERTIDTSPVRTFLGPCDVCGRDLYARAGAPEVECRPCALIYPVQARRDWLLGQAVDRLERAATIAAMLTTFGEPINAARIRQWAKRGRIEQRGADWSGNALYRVGEVLDLLRHMAGDTQAGTA